MKSYIYRARGENPADTQDPIWGKYERDEKDEYVFKRANEFCDDISRRIKYNLSQGNGSIGRFVYCNFNTGANGEQSTKSTLEQWLYYDFGKTIEIGGYSNVKAICAFYANDENGQQLFSKYRAIEFAQFPEWQAEIKKGGNAYKILRENFPYFEKWFSVLSRKVESERRSEIFAVLNEYDPSRDFCLRNAVAAVVDNLLVGKPFGIIDDEDSDAMKDVLYYALQCLPINLANQKSFVINACDREDDVSVFYASVLPLIKYNDVTINKIESHIFSNAYALYVKYSRSDPLEGFALDASEDKLNQWALMKIIDETSMFDCISKSEKDRKALLTELFGVDGKVSSELRQLLCNKERMNNKYVRKYLQEKFNEWSLEKRFEFYKNVISEQNDCDYSQLKELLFTGDVKTDRIKTLSIVFEEFQGDKNIENVLVQELHRHIISAGGISSSEIEEVVKKLGYILAEDEKNKLRKIKENECKAAYQTKLKGITDYIKADNPNCGDPSWNKKRLNREREYGKTGAKIKENKKWLVGLDAAMLLLFAILWGCAVYRIEPLLYQNFLVSGVYNAVFWLNIIFAVIGFIIWLVVVAWQYFKNIKTTDASGSKEKDRVYVGRLSSVLLFSMLIWLLIYVLCVSITYMVNLV